MGRTQIVTDMVCSIFNRHKPKRANYTTHGTHTHTHTPYTFLISQQVRTLFATVRTYQQSSDKRENKTVECETGSSETREITWPQRPLQLGLTSLQLLWNISWKPRSCLFGFVIPDPRSVAFRLGLGSGENPKGLSQRIYSLLRSVASVALVFVISGYNFSVFLMTFNIPKSWFRNVLKSFLFLHHKRPQ